MFNRNGVHVDSFNNNKRTLIKAILKHSKSISELIPRTSVFYGDTYSIGLDKVSRARFAWDPNVYAKKLVKNKVNWQMNSIDGGNASDLKKNQNLSLKINKMKLLNKANSLSKLLKYPQGYISAKEKYVALSLLSARQEDIVLPSISIKSFDRS